MGNTMRRTIAMLGLLTGLPLAAAAGELVLTNGQRISAELLNDSLLVSTGADLVEVDPAQVVRLTSREIRLRDGRVVTGTVVGGRIRARTPFGELSVKTDDIDAFRAEPPAAVTPVPPAPVSPAPAPVATAPAPAASASPPVPSEAPQVASVPAPSPAERPEGPTQVADGARKVGHGARDTAVGIGRTVSDAADMAHDGFKALGLRIWNAMRAVGETVRDAVTGRP